MPERKTLTLHRRCAVFLGAAVSALGGLSAQADNAALQALFFDACANPSGALAERCAETPGGLGDLSGDSESSLNPSQTLGATAATGSLVRERAERARRRDGHPAGDGEDTAGAVLDLGPFSLLINGHGACEDRDRTVDVDAERGYTLDVLGGGARPRLPLFARRGGPAPWSPGRPRTWTSTASCPASASSPGAARGP